ncbi:Friend leukemia integration 1 transcription like protein [Argiope bruennichi]|uniref:Friend leukemia integration 1 transcription like protein n=1 Tax=Argiope bruennichi TaxID=94029 RepID=A0A8T0E9M5_ARGBR|nr:Friend leukemia integration 1 transcription like protein [Argiope bruennichi]
MYDAATNSCSFGLSQVSDLTTRRSGPHPPCGQAVQVKIEECLSNTAEDWAAGCAYRFAARRCYMASEDSAAKAATTADSNRVLDPGGFNSALAATFRNSKGKGGDRRVVVPADPVLWNPEHVKQWLEWAVKEYNLHEVDAARFNVIGRELCQLTREDFSRLTNPYNGEVLYAHLNFLRQTSEASLPPASREKPPVSAQTGPSQVLSAFQLTSHFPTVGDLTLKSVPCHQCVGNDIITMPVVDTGGAQFEKDDPMLARASALAKRERVPERDPFDSGGVVTLMVAATSSLVAKCAMMNGFVCIDEMKLISFLAEARLYKMN